MKFLRSLTVPLFFIALFYLSTGDVREMSDADIQTQTETKLLEEAFILGGTLSPFSFQGFSFEDEKLILTKKEMTQEGGLLYLQEGKIDALIAKKRAADLIAATTDKDVTLLSADVFHLSATLAPRIPDAPLYYLIIRKKDKTRLEKELTTLVTFLSKP